MTPSREPERAFDESVATRYRLYSGLLLGLPYDLLQRVGRLLAVFAEHCRKGLQHKESPSRIVERFFAENPLLTDVSQDQALFLFLQLLERQFVLFDALEESSFTQMHDLAGAGSVAELVAQVRRDNRQADLGKLLAETATRIVLTAHPTQFYPDTVQFIIADLRGALAQNDPVQVERLLLQLGKTRFSNRERPSPIDEARGVLRAMEETFYDVLPGIVGQTLAAAHGRERLPEHLPARPNLQIGFWPGGDRDGNPFVTAAVTWEVARLLKERVLQCHYATAGVLARRLTFPGVHDRLLAIRERLRRTWLAAAADQRSTAMGDADQAARYLGAEELAHDLLELRKVVLRDHQRLFLDQLDDFILKVHVFGFFFASLDLRQSSDVLFASLQELLPGLGAAGGLSPSLVDAVVGAASSGEVPRGVLEELAESLPALPAELPSGLAPTTQDTIAMLRLLPRIQQSNGEHGLHRLIISHTHGPEDVLVVLALARLAGLPPDDARLDLVPLFESIEDLDGAQGIVARLLATPVYRAWLARRQQRQVVMLGFSDGTKDGGYFTANWSIRQARRALTALGRQHGIRMIFFDGRGGPPARGGGNTHRFYRSRDSSIEQLDTQLTVQGQTISSNFGNPDMAQYHVEQLFTANLENLLTPDRMDDPPPEFQPVLAEISATSFRAYRELRDDPAFLSLLGEQSPLPLFDHLTIASRPVSRRATATINLEDLRAIPFVATWSILKIQIPGFFGLGTALERLLEAGQEAELQRLYRSSRFFRTLLDNAAMSLLKSRFDVTAHLSRDERVGRLWQTIRDEAARVERCILRIACQPWLLASDPLVRASIHFREEMLLPLLVIVHDAFARYNRLAHQGQASADAAIQARKLALKGIAAVINATRNAA